ncbi:MAG TPA: alanine--tRNA ligase [Candidatus Atribacteria bacterium]|jgi:alanyl-tRNA synthetase|nr:alanine--tRNA ligase [Candidatus Atribacteria bacterium]
MTSSEIREKFLKFFESKGHKIIPGASLVPSDPSILLTIAGMVPFKPIFLGQVKSSLKRATTSQKCIRTNDIENVGRTARHHTFFEMLGNFSFGDYFKEDAIKWAWEFFTEVIGFPEEKLWVSIFKDDDESYDIWHNLIGLPEKRIIRLGEEDNFWKVGPTGPCGPCSEIYIDLGEEKASKEGGGVGVDERYLELWNLVFMQYNREEDGTLTPLPKQNIDTGLGLERITSVLQKVDTDFETDLFLPIIKFVAQNAGIKYKEDKKKDLALKVIADHIRALVFMISDGITPSNEGRGYVLRMLLRRAFRYGKVINYNQPFLYEVAPVAIDLMKEVYPETYKEENRICQIILSEEKRFQETLNVGIQILDNLKEELKQKNKDKLSGRDAFKLYDTYGFPLELTRDILEEDGYGIEEDDFKNEMKIQRERSRKSWVKTKVRVEDDKINQKLYQDILKERGETEFIGYDFVEAKSKVIAIIKDDKLVNKAIQGDKCKIFLEKTPFYAEKGGQIGDKGIITSPIKNNLLIEISDTQTPTEGLIAHFAEVSKGEIKVGDEVLARIDLSVRKAIARNHTATHLLHRALRDVLGDHVKQSGSAVNNHHLRFDFNHFAPLTIEELGKIENLVNEKILDELKVETKITTFDKAKEMGAIALFGEKYGEQVRVVKIGEFSSELCGGTHLDSTSNIGLFKILNEEGIGSGIRRIEAVTGDRALKYIKEKENIINEVSDKLNTIPSEIPLKINQLIDDTNNMKREIKIIRHKLTRYEVDGLISKKKEIKGINIISVKVKAADNNGLRNWGDLIKDKIKSGIVVLGTKLDNGKVALLVMVTDDLVQKGYDAGNIIKAIAPIVGGKGGGKKTMAQAGGQKADKLNQALEKVFNLPILQCTNSPIGEIKK